MTNVESKFQDSLIRELRRMFRDCVILKNDTSYLQGVPDLLVLFQDKWAMLECKASPAAPRQPNQAFYINLLGQMSFAAFINPENKDQVLHDLQLTFRPSRKTRVSKRQQVSLD